MSKNAIVTPLIFIYISVINNLKMDEKKTHYKTVQLPIEALTMLDKIIEA